MVQTELKAAAPAVVEITKKRLDAGADLLRTVAAHREPASRVAEDVLTMTASGYGPETIMQAAKLSRQELADIIKSIGHRYRVRGETLPEAESAVLFPIEPDPEIVKTFRKGKRERVMAEAAKLRVQSPLPVEWDLFFPSEVGVRNAVVAIRSKTEVDDNLRSVALRHAASLRSVDSGLITLPLLHAVWQVIQLGQFTRLATQTNLDPHVAHSVVRAYDALEASRSDSSAAVQMLRDAEPSDNLEILAVRGRPLAEAAIVRLENTLSAAEGHPKRDSFRLHALSNFRKEIRLMRLPDHVGQLNEGQVHRIARLLGLHVDNIPDKNLVEAEDRLSDLGLSADTPWLRGMWMAAFSNNREPDFWSAIDRLLAGDAQWNEPLM